MILNKEFINNEEGELICRNCSSNNFSFLHNLDYHKIFPLKNDFVEAIRKNSDDDIKIETLSSGLQYGIDNTFVLYENKKRSCPFTEGDGKCKRMKLENSSSDGEINYNNTKKEDRLPNYCENTLKMMEENNQNNKNLFKRISVKDNDLIIDIKSVIDSMCKCEKCSKIYEINGISYILSQNFCEELKSRMMIEDKLNEETDLKKEENQDLISNINNSNFFNIGRIKSLPLEKQIELRESYRNLKEEFVKYTNERVIPGNIITKEFVEEFMEDFKRNLAKKFPQEENN